MFRFLETLDLKSSPLSPRVYVVANTDKHSKKVAESFEERIFGKDTSHYTVKFIPRSREVGQSYLSSVFTTLWSLCHCLLLMLREKPDLVWFQSYRADFNVSINFCVLSGSSQRPRNMRPCMCNWINDEGT